jgi:hypothetical protein
MLAVHQRIGVRSFAIKMLSDDTTITSLVDQLMQLAFADHQDFKGIISIAKQPGPGLDLIDDARAKRPEREAREQFVIAIGTALMDYCTQHLRRL